MQRKFWIARDSNGIVGFYEGATKAEALDAMARIGGFESEADAAEVEGAFRGTLERVWAAIELDSERNDSHWDYQAWVAYVYEHIDERCGFEVEVAAADFGEVGARTKASDDDVRAFVDGAVQGLWNEWRAP